MKTEPTCAELIRKTYPRPPASALAYDWLADLAVGPPHVPPPPDPVFEQRLAQIVSILEPYLSAAFEGERALLLESIEDAVACIAEHAEAPPG